MIVIACVDEKNGMLFNGRRQSRDSVLCRDILRECRGKKLYISPYSSSLFEKSGDVKIIVSENIAAQAGEDSFCFMEDTQICGCEEQISRLILYNWNRAYPADFYLPLDISADSWELKRQEEFKGSSHERITKKVYSRRREG